METLTLNEWGPSAPLRLTPAERSALERIGDGSVAIAPAAEDGWFVLTPGSRIGAIHLGERELIIRPKLPMTNVLYLVSYALGRAHWPGQEVGFAEDPSIVEAVVPGFVHQAGRALRRGLLHGYRTEEDALLTVRGRVRFEDQIRARFGRFPPAEVRFDEFTADIEENRLLRAACARLSRLRLRSERAARGLRAVTAALGTIPLVDYDPRRVPAVAYTRLNEHYRPAVELARLILRATAFEHRAGGVRASAFLIDMNQVFEDFVVIALREDAALGLSEAAFPQGVTRRLHLDSGHTVKLIPDMSWWEGGRCLFVGDAKYKQTEGAGAQSGDLYQMLAYTIAADVPAGLLVYAAGEAEPGEIVIPRADKRIVVRTLDLGGGIEQIRASVHALARTVRRLRAPVSAAA